jgi:GT2 family glycosyltransferase
MKISIVTPWHNCPELIGQYEAAVAGADEVVIVDNASDVPTQGAIEGLRHRNIATGRVKVVRTENNVWFSAACNMGYERSTGDVVLFLNNDIIASPDWLDRVRADIRDGGIYGPAAETRTVAQQPMTYLDGWCVAARRETWAALGGPWDADTFPMYYSDVDLSWRAYRAGYPLRVRTWAVRHLSNYTSQRTEGAYTDSEAAFARFTARVEAGR